MERSETLLEYIVLRENVCGFHPKGESYKEAGEVTTFFTTSRMKLNWINFTYSITRPDVC